MNINQINDITKICRICLADSENMRSIHSALEENEIFEDNILRLSDVLARITYVPIQTEECLPSLVCSKCIVLINSAYKFKVKFDYSYQFLQKYLADFQAKVDTNSLTSNFGGEDTIVSISEENNDNLEALKCDKRQEDICFNEKNVVESKINETKAKKTRRSSRSSTQQHQLINNKSNLDINNGVNGILHPCPVCTKEFTALQLKDHIQSHKALKRYLSIPDDKKVDKSTKFYANPKLKKPVISIFYRKDKKHKCLMCFEEFTAADLKNHIPTHRNQKEFRCDQCDRVFKKLNHLNTHRVKHLKEFPYQCSHCGKGFVIKTNYDCHILTHNIDKELPHECKHCLKRFSNPEHLNRHLLIHTENVSYSVKYKVCKCKKCLETFRDKSEFKLHNCIPVEQANVKLNCNLCKKVFKSWSGLFNHRRNIHQLKAVKVLCSVCGKHVSNIYSHMMRHNGEKPFSCEFCDKKFIGRPQLKQHLLVHSGRKPFSCSVCSKAFNNYYNLQVHERIHKGDRCHICFICQKGFLEKSYLKKHMKVHQKS